MTRKLLIIAVLLLTISPSLWALEKPAYDISKEFQCDFCYKILANSGSLINHERMHKPKSNWRCEECPRTFSRKHLYEEHIQAHSGNKPFACDPCAVNFARLSCLKRHYTTQKHLDNKLVNHPATHQEISRVVLKNKIDKKTCVHCGIAYIKNHKCPTTLPLSAGPIKAGSENKMFSLEPSF
jgi:uncharacterized Zn-finger protein